MPWNQSASANYTTGGSLFFSIKSSVHNVRIAQYTGWPSKIEPLQMSYTITNSDLNRPCFAWHPNGKSGLFKTELVIVVFPKVS